MQKKTFGHTKLIFFLDLDWFIVTLCFDKTNYKTNSVDLFTFLQRESRAAPGGGMVKKAG